MKKLSSWICLLLLILAALAMPACSGDQAGHDAATTTPEADAPESSPPPPATETPPETPADASPETDGAVDPNGPGESPESPEDAVEAAQG